MGPGRLHALIDGVFAIALTLLVLDLPRPAHARNLTRELLHQWPSYVAYLVTFATIGVLWIEHHGMMSAVKVANRRFMERTLVFLLTVSVIPWPTALAAEFGRQGGANARTAAVVYSAILFAMGLAFVASWRYLRRRPELVYEPARGGLQAAERRALAGSAAYLLAILLAFVVPVAAFAIDGALAVYFALSRSGVPALMVRASAGRD